MLNFWGDIKFWQKADRFVKRKLREHSSGTKCPGCKRWEWEMYDKPATWKMGVDSSHYIMQCAVCETESTWFDTGFMGAMTCLSHPPKSVFDAPPTGDKPVKKQRKARIPSPTKKKPI